MTRMNSAFTQFADELARIRGRVDGAFRTVRQSLELSHIDVVVLNSVIGASHPLTVPQISRSLGYARQVIQRAAGGLLARGIIAMQDNPDHKRARLLVATDPGRELKAEYERRALALMDSLNQGLKAGAVEEAARGLNMIRITLERNLRRAGADKD